MEWYPDPADPTRERYWDGTQWTHNTRPVKAPAGGADPWTAHDAGTRATATPAAGPWTAGGGATHPGTAPAGHLVPATRARLSGWWRRALAGLVDTLLVTLIGGLAGLQWTRTFLSGLGRLWHAMYADAQAGRTRAYTPAVLEQFGMTTGLLNALTMVLAAVTFAYLLLSWALAGRTPGQALTGIRVVPAAAGGARLPEPGAQRPGPVRAAARALVWTALLFLPYGMALVLVSVVMPLFHPRRQGLHDLLARTQVVRTR